MSRVNPLQLVSVVILLHALRWVCIANGHDFGWEFETGFRASLGGIYGRDYYTALGPLSYEIVGFLFKNLGAKWIYAYVITYVSWSLTMLGVYQLLRNVTTEPLYLAFALLIVTPLSIPHLVALHNYNFISYSFAVWSGVLFFRYLDSGHYRWLWLSGFLVALALFTKQNIGMGTLFLTLIMLVSTPFLTFTKTIQKTAISIFVFLAAFTILSGFLFYAYSRAIGSSELWRLMFTDAAQAKGNALNIIKTAIPRMTFGTSNDHNLIWVLQHVAESFFFIVALGISFLLFKDVMPQDKRKNEIRVPLKIQHQDLVWAVIISVSILFIPLFIPSTIFLYREKFYWFDQNYRLSPLILSFVTWIVLISGGFYVFSIFKMGSEYLKENYKKILLFLFSTGLGFFVCTSRFTYIFLTVALFGGYFFASTLSLGCWNRRALVILALLLWTGVYLFYPTHALAPLVRLDGQQLTGLWFGDTERSFVELYTKKLKPYVKGKRTLWLSMGGPHSLSEAIPVRNVSNLYFDQFNSRIEESLVKDWMANPPEMIIRYWYALPGDSVWLRSELFEIWLKKNYVQVAEIEGRKVLKYRF